MWPQSKTVMLIIHGIGQQNPFDTLDGFVRGLWTALEAKNPDSKITGEHHLFKRGDRTENCVILKKDGDAATAIHCFEYYWAHLTERRISMGEVFDWLVQTGAAAQKYYDQNAEMVQAYEEKNDEAFGPHYSLGGGNLLRGKLPTIKKTTRFRKYWYLKRAGWVLRAAQMLMNGLDPILDRFPVFGKPIKVALTVIGSISKPFIVNYIGDIAIYTTMDVKAKHYQIREQILRGAVDKVEWLVQSTELGFESIVIAGHSLGSVVGYDAINRLNNAMASGRVPERLAPKMRGLATFGSPLDKIAFFFKQRVPDAQYIKEQILTHYHGFKAKNPRPDWTPPRPVENRIGQFLDHVRWVNFWHAKDPISGPLDFYEIPSSDNRELREEARWGVAHVKYWENERMYEEILSDLLV